MFINHFTNFFPLKQFGKDFFPTLYSLSGIPVCFLFFVLCLLEKDRKKKTERKRQKEKENKERENDRKRRTEKERQTESNRN